MNTLTSAAMLLEAANWVAVVIVADLLADGVNLSLLTGVVVVILLADVILLVLAMVSGAILFPFTEAACA